MTKRTDLRRGASGLRARATLAAGSLVAGLALLVGGAVTVGAQPRQTTPTPAGDSIVVASSDTSNYPEVKLVVACGQLLCDQAIDPSAFRLTEGGKSRDVSVETLPADQLEVALVIDTSGSMAGAPLAAAKQAAEDFAGQLPPSVPVAVVGFGAVPTVTSGLSTDRTAQKVAIESLRAGGETALYDGVLTGLSQVPPGPHVRQVIVVLSDGGDTRSVTPIETAVTALGASKAALFAVSLQTSESNPAALARLASAGGKVVPVGDPKALVGAFGEVAEQIVHQYALTYTSKAKTQTDVTITLTAPGGKATVTQHLILPDGKATTGASTASPAAAPAPTAVPTKSNKPAFAFGAWALAAGAALIFLALCLFLARLIASYTPKARGVSSGEGGLARVADLVESITDTVLEKGGRASRLGDALEEAGIDLRPGEFVVITMSASLVGFALGYFMLDIWLGIGLAAAVLLVANVSVAYLRRRRRDRFTDQLGETLQLLAGGLRAGHGMAQCIEAVARESEPPTADEFRRLTVETRLGRDFVDAMYAMSDRMGSSDFLWVVQAIEINREIGGDLADIFDTVGSTIRDRNRLRRQVSALTAEGRLSAWALVLLPFGLAGVMAVLNPDYLKVLYTTSGGRWLLATALVLMAGGIYWLRRLVRPIF